MRRDNRLSIALHAVLHIAESKEPLTSEFLADRMSAHPVVVRRTLAGLREADILCSEKGHGGGWTLGRPLEEVTMADVWAALDVSSLFAVGNRVEASGCVLERAINRVTDDALGDATHAFTRKLAAVRLSDLLAGARRLHRARAAKKSRAEGRRHHHA